MSKTVQIPDILFWDLCRYFLTGQTDEDTEKAIQDALKAKLKAMQRRAVYSAYKDARASQEAREAARQEYLNIVGMLPGYRW